MSLFDNEPMSINDVMLVNLQAELKEELKKTPVNKHKVQKLAKQVHQMKEMLRRI